MRLTVRSVVFFLLGFLLGQAAFSCLAAQVRYPTDGRVAEPAASFLAERYRADIEQGYCITRWHIERDSVVVDEVIRTTGTLDQGPYHISFLCPSGTVRLHTHDPRFPRPSATDVRESLIDGVEPFAVIQWGPDRFAFWIRWDRAGALPGTAPTGKS